MAYAGFVDFLQMLFTIFLVLIGIGYLLVLIFPFVLRLITKKLMRNFQNSMNIPNDEPPVGNSSNEQKEKKVGKVVGEYIDFEEVK